MTNKPTNEVSYTAMYGQSKEVEIRKVVRFPWNDSLNSSQEITDRIRIRMNRRAQNRLRKQEIKRHKERGIEEGDLVLIKKHDILKKKIKYTNTKLALKFDSYKENGAS